MRSRIEMYRRRRGTDDTGPQDYKVGCIILTEPTFFAEPDWIVQPRDWHPNTQVGRAQDLTAGEGLRIWEAVMARLRSARTAESVATGRYGAPLTVHPRLGQGAFRVLVTDTYQRRCAVTGERTLPVLQAGHIRPYAAGGAHVVRNGLLLRSELHTLFDRGYVTVTPDYRLEVSRRIREEFENGREYYALSGRKIRLPGPTDAHPDPDLLDWHNHHVFHP